MWTRTQLKETAKLVLKKNYGAAILVALVLTIFIGGASGTSVSTNYNNNKRNNSSAVYDIDADPFDILEGYTMSPAMTAGITVAVIVVSVISLLVGIFVGNPLIVGCRKFFVEDYDTNPSLGLMGYAFNGERYLKIVGNMFLMQLFIGLWSLLFIIPGIYKSYEYRMIPYLIGENPNMTFDEAKNTSKAMMDGNKWDAFVLDLSFIGWFLLSALTCGILSILYVNPYMFITQAGLYRALANRPAPNFNGTNGYNAYSNPAGYGAAGGQQTYGQNYQQPYNQAPQQSQYGQNFDPMTGQPVNPQQSQYGQNFDPMTGQPLNQGAPVQPQAPTQPNVPQEPTNAPNEEGSIFSNNNL